jgi:DNA/RNA-binding domain of Phe-tRNA-synthetase-like protein
MPQLRVHNDAALLGIAHPTACLISNVRITSSSLELEAEIAWLMRRLANAEQTILNRPEVHGFRELFGQMGYRAPTPAGHRLIESLRQRGFNRYNNVIDACNISSALFGSGLGIHDALFCARGHCDIHVYRARGDETILPLFRDKRVTVNAGDLVYGFEGREMTLLAWLGKRDVDSDDFKVKNDTSSLLLVALGNAKTSEKYNTDACEKTVELMRLSCPTIAAQFLDIVFYPH